MALGSLLWYAVQNKQQFDMYVKMVHVIIRKRQCVYAYR